MRRGRKKRRVYIFLLFSCSCLFFLLSSSYAILNTKVNVYANASIDSNEVSGKEYVVDVVGSDDSFVENADGSYDFVGTDGSLVHNYVQIPGDSYLWRILSIDISGNLKIIRNRDDSFTSVFDMNGNANDWPNTTIYQKLQLFYQENLSDLSNIIVQNPEWLLTQADKKSGPTTVTVVGTFRDSPIGLIRNDEILTSSGEGITGNTVSSWLNDGYQWTMTYFTNKSNTAWKVNGGKFMNSNASSGGNTVARPVIYLKSDIIFSSGTGTEDDPFKVQ